MSPQFQYISIYITDLWTIAVNFSTVHNYIYFNVGITHYLEVSYKY